MAELTIDNLVKNYPGFRLGPLDLQIETGTAVGLVGANGAGKTTLFRCLMGTVRRDSGRIAVCDTEIMTTGGPCYRQIGYVGDSTPLFDSWSGEDNLRFFSRFYPAWDRQLALQIADRLELDLRTKPKAYSTGQRTKLAITLALAPRPRLLFLDEPATGLDPVAREAFMELLFEALADEEVSILYATHHVSEIERIADRLVFIKRGQVAGDMIKEDLHENWRALSFRSDAELANVPHQVARRNESAHWELITDNASTTIAYLKGKGIDQIASSRLSLEQIAVQILKGMEKGQGDRP